jgi:hypothetical protein
MSSTASVDVKANLHFSLLGEPHLLFANHFLTTDPKLGLAHAGPFGKDTPLHPPQVILSLVGSYKTVEMATNWIDR